MATRIPCISLQPRKRPRQARSAATVRALLDAAARVLATESLAGFNTNRVAEVAGVSVGSLYQYFPNKDALVGALIAEAQNGLAEALEDAVARAAGLPLDAALAHLVELAVQQQYSQPLLAAALDHEERRLPVAAKLAATEARIAAAVQVLLDRHRAELAPDLPAAAARDCLLITKALVEADAGRLREPPPDLAARALRALRGYLCTPFRPAAPRPRAARASGAKPATRAARR